MIVACPNCQSKYNLPEAKIAPTGSKVRCAKCKHVFTVTPPVAQVKDFEAELAELTAAAAPKPAPAPAAPRPEPAPAPKPAPADKMPWEDEDFGAAAPAPKAPTPAPADKMPWEDEDFGAAAPAPAKPAAAPAPAQKMPWDDDAPAAGPVGDDDDLPGHAAPRAAGPFDDEPAAPAPRQDPYAASAAAFADDEPAPVSAQREAATDDFLNSLGPGAAEPAPQPKPSGKKKILTIALVVALLAAIAGGLFYFKPWNKFNIPFLSGSSSTKKEGSDNAEKVKDIALRNVRQYYIPNEKAGNIFVVEGKAVNNFSSPKERIKVEITLFDEKGHPLGAKQILCGNTLSQFQLQVQSEEEINASLGSEVGILTSNTYLKTGMDTPFMAVFFKPPDAVKEFGVKVIDALDPK